MKVRYVPVFALVGVLTVLSGMPLLSSGSIITNYAYARYANTNTQSQGNSNECNTGTNCAITSPQTQEDGTANSPTNLQISRFNEEEPDDGVGDPDPFERIIQLHNCRALAPDRIVCGTDPFRPERTIVCYIGGSHSGTCEFPTIELRPCSGIPQEPTPSAVIRCRSFP